jgi:hypothetical protein
VIGAVCLVRECRISIHRSVVGDGRPSWSVGPIDDALGEAREDEKARDDQSSEADECRHVALRVRAGLGDCEDRQL